MRAGHHSGLPTSLTVLVVYTTPSHHPATELSTPLRLADSGSKSGQSPSFDRFWTRITLA